MNFASVNLLRKYFKERKLDWVYQESVRALVNAPCPRVSALGTSPLLQWWVVDDMSHTESHITPTTAFVHSQYKFI